MTMTAGTTRVVRRATCLLAVLLLVTLAGCGGSATKDVKDTLVIAVPTQPENLNPIYGDNLYEGNLKFFNGLLTYDADLQPVPDLARSLPRRSDDGLTVTVDVRDDVTFSDGKPFTAKDVAFTYDAIMDPQNASTLASLLDRVDSVEAVDTDTVKFTFSEPDPAFDDKLQFGILPEHLLEGKDLKTAEFNVDPVGTGPYVLDQFKPGSRVVMTANADYFKGAPKIKRVVMTAVADESARAAQLQNGSVDIAGLVPKLAPRFRDDDAFKVYEVDSADARVFALPERDPVLKDPEVRRALAYAVDREGIVDGVLAGAGTPAYGPVMPGHWAYSDVATTAFDPDKAAGMLDAAGWKLSGDAREKNGRPLTFEMMYPSDDSVRKDVALAVASNLSDVGVDVELKGTTFDYAAAHQDEGAMEFGYGLPYDPDLELYTLFHSKYADDDDAFTNYARIDDSTIDAALDAERGTFDRTVRKQAFGTLQSELAKDAGWLWVVRLKHIVVASDRVHGIDPITEPHAHGFSRGTSWNIEDWTLDPVDG